MAIHNSTRRIKAQRPKSVSISSPVIPLTELTDIRRRLDVVRAIAYVCSAALEHQDADADMDVSRVLQRAVGDELDRQIERLDTLLRQERKP
jgi:hypothetical protein